MYMASPRGAAPHHKQIPDGPIQVFSAIIEDSKADAWKKRIKALVELVENIPEGSAYSEGTTWFNTPAMLRHLALPISELIKDARSTVVKRTCEQLTMLFNRCQTDARYLFKDIMPTILAVHAQTVQVIRLAVQNMVMESIPEVPCKMIMPLWMERLKVDKSRTVREACALYLGQALMSWTEEGYLTEEIWMQVGTVLIRTLRDPSPDVRFNAKAALTKMRTAHPRHWDSLVNDPEGPAAKDAKAQKWLKKFEAGRSDHDELSVNSKSSFNSDSRFVPGLTRSSPSRRNNLPLPLIAMPPSSAAAAAAAAAEEYAVPKSIAVTKAARDRPVGQQDPHRTLQPKVKRTGGLGPPLRRPFAQAVGESPDPKVPPRPPAIKRSHTNPSYSDDDHNDDIDNDIDSDNDDSSRLQKTTSTDSRLQKTISTDSGDNGIPPFHSSTNHNNGSNNNATDADAASHPLQTAFSTDTGSTNGHDNELPHFPSNLHHTMNSLQDLNKSLPTSPRAITSPHSFELSYDEDDDEEEDDEDEDDEINGATGNFIVSIEDLKNHASKRRSFNSLLMQERFRMSTSNHPASNSFIGAASSSLVEEEEEDDDEHDDNDDSKGAAAEKAIENIMSDKHSEEENEVPNNSGGEKFIIDVTKTPTHAPEHMVIAIRLLRAHKEHVDTVMETLKIEMDTLRDFDNLLEETGRPTEEEVLDYFEGLGLCLDQRTQSGTLLQREMDRISRGEPPRK